MGLLDWLWGTNVNGSGVVPSIEAGPSAPAPAPNVGGGANAAPPGPSAASYGIESAIDLMRTLPFDENPDLVLRVVRKTLRSIGVSVEDIIDSASLRETALMADAAKHRAVIEQLEQEIAARRTSIEHVERELAETQSVRQRLEDAIENETKVGPMTAEMARLHSASARGEHAGAGSVPSTPAASAASAAFAAPVSTASPPRSAMPPPLPKSAMPPVPKKSVAPPKLPVEEPRKG